jgi:hypothetical protein
LNSKQKTVAPKFGAVLRALVMGGSLALMGSGLVSCAPKKAVVAPVVKEIPAQSFARQWSLDLQLGKASIEWVRTAGEYIIAFSSERRAYVIARGSGRLVGVHEIRGKGDVLEPFTNGSLFVYPVSTQLELFESERAYDRRPESERAEGQPKNTINLGVAVQTSGAVSDTTIYMGVAGVNGGRLRAVDPTRFQDTPKWEVLAGGPIVGAPVWFDQTVYFATNEGRVFAVNENRTAIWPQEKGFFQAGLIQAPLAVDEYGVYVGSTDTRLICLNRRTGRVLWQFFAGEPVLNPAIPAAENVYVFLRGQGLAAIQKAEGKFNRTPRWVSREATMFLAEDAKFAYVRLRGNAIGALDKTTGEVKFRSGRSNMDFFVTNTGKDGLVFGATKEGYLIGIKPVTAPGTVGEMLFVEPGK